MSFLKMDNIDYVHESSLDNMYTNGITTESYFCTALVAIAECNNDYRKAYKNFVISLNENINLPKAVYNEFIGQVNSIIDKFGKCIKDNHKNYMIALKKKMSSDKISLDKDKLSAVIAHDIYEYTITSDIPKDIGSDIYFCEVEKLQSILKNNSLDQEQKSIEMLYLYTELVDGLRGPFYDKFRAEVIGKKNEQISSLDYDTALFNVYRNGGQKITKTIEVDEILKIEKRFKDSKSYICDTERKRDSIVREYDRIKKRLSEIKLGDIASMLGSNAAELDDRLKIYIKVKTDQVLNMCTIHTLAYTAKLDAIASMYLQDRAVLLEAERRYTEINDMKVSEIL